MVDVVDAKLGSKATVYANPMYRLPCTRPSGVVTADHRLDNAVICCDSNANGSADRPTSVYPRIGTRKQLRNSTTRSSVYEYFPTIS